MQFLLIKDNQDPIDKYSLCIVFVYLFLIVGCASHKEKKPTIIEDRSHFSKVFDEDRRFRVFLPPDYYESSEKIYPVIYFFHGYGGRFNGPAEGEPGVSAEARYYDAFNGNWERCGPDSLDNIAEYVRTHDVIVAKWDGFMKKQYPRPYDIGPVKEDIQFTDYFPEFVKHIEDNYRVMATREGRAVSGLSMGGFMSMNIAAKYPHMISSASFFCPAAAFSIGPEKLQVYTQFKKMRINYVGLPIRMHTGQNDFLRQYHCELDQSFKDIELAYESWNYGVNYFNGFHNVVNVKGQFDFHMKYFRMPVQKPDKWNHIDVFPNFQVWGYKVKSDRSVPGFTILEDVHDGGLRVSCQKWLYEGPFIANNTVEIETDRIYVPGREYQIITSTSPYEEVKKMIIKADKSGRLNFKALGKGSDIGIFSDSSSVHLSVPNIRLSVDMPTSGNVFQVKPVIFNKGGRNVQDVEVALISKNADLEVLTGPQMIGEIPQSNIHDQTHFDIQGQGVELEEAMIQVVLSYDGKTEVFWERIPFFNPDIELKSYEISDGRFFLQEKSDEEDSYFGNGNGDGVVDPGEKISVFTQPKNLSPNWYGLKLYTNDPYIDNNKEGLKYNERKDWSGAMRATSEVFVKPDCPIGHIIRFYGVYDYPKKGNIKRDKQAAHSFIHEKKRVFLLVKVGQN